MPWLFLLPRERRCLLTFCSRRGYAQGRQHLPLIGHWLAVSDRSPQLAVLILEATGQARSSYAWTFSLELNSPGSSSWGGLEVRAHGKLVRIFPGGIWPSPIGHVRRASAEGLPQHPRQNPCRGPPESLAVDSPVQRECGSPGTGPRAHEASALSPIGYSTLL